MKSRRIRCLAAGALALLASGARAQSALTPEQFRAVAKEAYVYGYPIVDSYRIIYAYTQDKSGPEYKAPLNTLANVARVYGPEDKAIQTPNADTPYSFLVMDLRAEPMVLTLPRVPKERYFSVQLADLYTYDFAYLGSRTTGNEGGDYLVAGPAWKGEAPPGVKQVIRAETDLVVALYRTQLFGPDDLENAKRIQAGYRAQTLSAYLGQPPPPAPYFVNWRPPLSREQMRSSPEFFAVLTFALQFAPVHPSETALRARLDVLGGLMTGAQHAALAPGMADGQKEIDARAAKLRSSAELFGTRQSLGNDYAARALGAQLGIYGNAKEEALYFGLDADAKGKPLDGAKGRYTLRFAKGRLPPVNAFWSLTMYGLPEQLLVENPLHRYLINSPMLASLARDEDGGITLYLQHDSPGKQREANWLPAPSGPFSAVLRLYWPKPPALKGAWKPPVIRARPRDDAGPK